MTARIASVIGRQVWDSRGRPTVEAEVTLANGKSGRAIAPAGASRGAHEAIDLRDGGERFGGYGVTSAVAGIAAEIAPALIGMDTRDQVAIDRVLCELDGTPNKARLGANAIVAVSLAALHAAAADAREPLWRYLADGRAVRLPLPEIQIFGGGAHAGRRTDVQDFMVMCPRAGSFRRALEITDDVYRAAGRLMQEKGLDFDLCFTSVQTRAIKTLHLALEEMGRLWLPVEKDWPHLVEAVGKVRRTPPAYAVVDLMVRYAVTSSVTVPVSGIRIVWRAPAANARRSVQRAQLAYVWVRCR